MFTTPNCGWVDIILDEYTDRASYLTDVPNDCLDAFIHGIKKYLPASVYFDAEGWEYTLVATWFQSYIITNRNNKEELIVIKKDIVELAKDFLSDIKGSYDEWCKWDYDETRNKRNKKGLIKKIDQLEKLIVDLENKWKDIKCK